MSTNRYPAKCTRCKKNVPAGEGSLTKNGSGWEVRHIEECPDVEGLAVRWIVTDEPRWRDGVVFEYEDSGVVVAMAHVPLPQFPGDGVDEWQTYARAATAEELETFATQKTVEMPHDEKLKVAMALMDGRSECICWIAQEACKVHHFDKTRDAEHLNIHKGRQGTICANIPADSSQNIFIYSFHGKDHDAEQVEAVEMVKELKYTSSVVEMLRWKAKELKNE